MIILTPFFITKPEIILVHCYLKDVVKKVEETEVDGTTPKKDCVIADSGIEPLDEPYNVDKD